MSELPPLPEPFHPDASHIPPDYRDGWNAACRQAHLAMAPLEARIKELEARLEIDPRHSYDGIECRDETIRMLEAENARIWDEAIEAAATDVAHRYIYGHSVAGPHFTDGLARAIRALKRAPQGEK